MVLSYLLEPNWGRHGLEKLALHYLQETKTPYEDIVGQGKNELTMDKVAVERAAPYACQDAALALELGAVLWEKIEAKKPRPALRRHRTAARSGSWPGWRSGACASTPRC